MTLEPYSLDDDDDSLSFLLRLEHIFEIGEDEKLSLPETISIKVSNFISFRLIPYVKLQRFQ